MKIFSDLHHTDLYASFHYLFEKRLGHELYRPIGMDWFNLGFWKIAEPYNNNPATVSQYLNVGGVSPDGTNPLNKVEKETEGIHYVWDEQRDYHHKAIEFEKFCEMDFDIIIASIPAHIPAYKKLIKEHMPNAKLIYHIGNIGWHEHVPWKEADNLMASIKEFDVPEGKNVVFYRQEFDLDIFKPAEFLPNTMITSFVSLLPEKLIWESFTKLLPTYEHRAYGITCPDGLVTTLEEIAGIMRVSKFGYHNKPFGDGFGHIIHNWFASGRPVIVNLSDYKDQLAGELMVDGKTCIDMSNRTIEEVVAIIENMSNLEYFDMCENVRNIFKEKVNFEKDSHMVEEFLQALK